MLKRWEFNCKFSIKKRQIHRKKRSTHREVFIFNKTIKAWARFFLGQDDTSNCCLEIYIKKQMQMELTMLLEDPTSHLVLNPFIFMIVTNTLTLRTRKEVPQIRFSATLSSRHRIKMNWKRTRNRDARCGKPDYKLEWLQATFTILYYLGKSINCNSWVNQKRCRLKMRVSD